MPFSLCFNVLIYPHTIWFRPIDRIGSNLLEMNRMSLSNSVSHKKSQWVSVSILSPFFLWYSFWIHSSANAVYFGGFWQKCPFTHCHTIRGWKVAQAVMNPRVRWWPILPKSSHRTLDSLLDTISSLLKQRKSRPNQDGKLGYRRRRSGLLILFLCFF